MNSSPHAGRWTLRLKSRWRRAPCWRGTTARCLSALGTPSKTCLPQVWAIKQTSRCIIVLFAFFRKWNITYSDKLRFWRLYSQNLELESDWRGHSWGLLTQHLDKISLNHHFLFEGVEALHQDGGEGGAEQQGRHLLGLELSRQLAGHGILWWICQVVFARNLLITAHDVGGIFMSHYYLNVILIILYIQNMEHDWKIGENSGTAQGKIAS